MWSKVKEVTLLLQTTSMWRPSDAEDNFPIQGYPRSTLTSPIPSPTLGFHHPVGFQITSPYSSTNLEGDSYVEDTTSVLCGKSQRRSHECGLLYS